jgi:hypothetical protein
VVASLTEAFAGTPDAVPSAASARKAGLLGAAVGLAFVALFVIGARLAYHPARDVPAAPPVVWPQASITQLIPSAAPTSPPAPAPTASVTADSTGAPAPQPKRSAPVARPASTAGVVAAAARNVARNTDTPSEGASSGASAGPATAATTTAAGQTAPAADSATSLIPVIPASPPPELDPLVKAVLEDDTPHRK